MQCFQFAADLPSDGFDRLTVDMPHILGKSHERSLLGRQDFNVFFLVAIDRLVVVLDIFRGNLGELFDSHLRAAFSIRAAVFTFHIITQ